MIKPYYEEPGITIYNADCRDVLPQLEPVDLVLTDPPYGIGFDYGTDFKDSKNGYIEFLWPIIETTEKLISSGVVALFQAAKNCRNYSSWFPREWRLIAIAKKFGQWMPNFIQHRTDYILFWEIGEGIMKHQTEFVPRDFLFPLNAPIRHLEPVLIILAQGL